jgi:hypothetical protein
MYDGKLTYARNIYQHRSGLSERLWIKGRFVCQSKESTNDGKDTYEVQYHPKRDFHRPSCVDFKQPFSPGFRKEHFHERKASERGLAGSRRMKKIAVTKTT